MSGQRAAAEPYATRFESEVTAVDGTQVWLETTHFFAECGGQPADRGTIGDVTVEDVQLVDGEHVHQLAEEPPFRAGHRVLCSIDWSFRMYCMRAHTASHVLAGAARTLLEDVAYAGLEIDEERVRLDVRTATDVDDEGLVELDDLVNRAIWESRPVSWDTIPLSEAKERDDVMLTDALANEAVSKGQVRLVTIGSKNDNGQSISRTTNAWDVAACGGTHVRNTRETGPVTIFDRSTADDGVTSIEFAVGPRAIEYRAAEKDVTFTARRLLDSSVDGLSSDLEAAIDRLPELEAENRKLQGELVERTLLTETPIERNGDIWIVSTVDGIEPEALGDAVRDLPADYGDVVAVVGETDYPFAVVRSRTDLDASAVIEELVTQYGGGGGGSASFAQGGGFDVPTETVLERLKSWP